MLFKSDFRDLCYLAIQYVKDYDTAKDIVQEVFVTIWKKKEEIDLSKQVHSYLRSSVRNKCLNYLRDHKKFSDSLIETEDRYIQSDTRIPDKLVENELRRKIDASIGELPGRYREIFLLSRHENLKYLEIAERLNISVKTVEAQMSKALQHLRSKLEEFLPFFLLLSSGFLQ